MIRTSGLRIYKNVRFPKTIFGKNVWVFENVRLFNCSIGNYTYIQTGSIIQNSNIGSYCSIAAGVMIGLGRHPVRESFSTSPYVYSQRKEIWGESPFPSEFEENLPVKIGNDVYIGVGAVILDGVEIGDGAVIGASAVVTKNVKPYQIVGGIPAKEIKMRFTDAVVEKLINSGWWSKDRAELISLNELEP